MSDLSYRDNHATGNSMLKKPANKCVGAIRKRNQMCHLESLLGYSYLGYPSLAVENVRESAIVINISVIAEKAWDAVTWTYSTQFSVRRKGSAENEPLAMED